VSGVIPETCPACGALPIDWATRPTPAQEQGWRTDDCRARGDWSEDAVEQLAHELSWELEEASLSANDYVTVNREKLRTIAKRVLARLPPPLTKGGEDA